jgi:hypothetical protein
MTAKYHINPRFRAYGKARLDVTLRARDEQEWQQMWRQPLNSFPFKFGTGWKFCFEYQVDDFAAEVGFYIDVLGFNVNAFSPHYAQFSSPGGELCISIVQAGEGEDSTPADTIRLQLQIRDIEKTSRELETRNVVYEKSLGIEHDAESTLAGFFRTPHGVRYDLWEQSSGSTSLIDDEDEDYDYDDYEDEDEYDDTVDEDRIDDDPFDGGQNLNLAEMDEDEADRVLNELLGLSDDSQSDLDQDALDQTDLDDMDDNEDDYTDDAEESDNDDYIDDQSVDAERQASFISKGSKFSIHQNTNWNASDRPIQRGANMSQLPSQQSSSRPVNWPRDNDSRGPELTYGDIEEDLGYETDLD